jgi:hypothetical protein
MGWFSTKKQDGNATSDIEKRLEFSRKLQAVTNQIHATSNLDQIMLDLSKDICDLFHCERLTLFAVSRDKEFIYSKIKTGIETDSDLVLPVNDHSIAGWVALTGCTVRIRDVYDKTELRKYAENLSFNRTVDQITGYRTKQMLVAPIYKVQSNELLGAIQLLNTRAGDAFAADDEAGIGELCETLAIAYTKRMKPPVVATSKYNTLIVDAIISQAEFELAARSARRQNLDVEDVLIDEFQVPVPAVGKALSKAFNLPYECFAANRKKPEQIIHKIDRAFIDENRCMPIEDDGKNIVIMTTDPEHAVRVGAARRIFPYSSLFYRVTTKREFAKTLEYFYGPQP